MRKTIKKLCIFLWLICLAPTAASSMDIKTFMARCHRLEFLAGIKKSQPKAEHTAWKKDIDKRLATIDATSAAARNSVHEEMAPRLWRYLAQYIANDEDRLDILQETLIHVDNLLISKPIEVRYYFSSARYMMLRFWKEKKKIEVIYDDGKSAAKEIDTSSVNPEKIHLLKSELEALMPKMDAAMRRLTYREREILTLYHGYQNLPLTDIARIFIVTEDRAKQIIDKARLKFRGMLKQILKEHPDIAAFGEDMRKSWPSQQRKIPSEEDFHLAIYLTIKTSEMSLDDFIKHLASE